MQRTPSRALAAMAVSFAAISILCYSAFGQERPTAPPSGGRPPVTQPGLDRPARPPGGDQPRQGRQPAGQAGQVIDAIGAAAKAVQPNEQQVQRIDDILAAARQELANLAPRLQDVPPQQQRQEIQGLTQGVVEDVAGVLTAEQRPLFREELERMRQQQQRRQGQNPPGGAQRQGQYFEQLAAAFQQLGLNDEQRRQVDEALTALREDSRRIMAEARQNGADPQAAQQASRQRMEEFRQTLEGILTPEQMRQLNEEMQRRTQRPPPEGNPPPGNRPPPQPGDGQGRPDQPGMAMDGTRGDQAEQTDQVNRSAFLDRLNEPPGLAVGERLGDTVKVVTLTNKERPLRETIPRSKPLVVFLGSSSSPTFRDRMADFFSLRQQIGRDADLLIIYTREQHAAGEWTVERNKEEGIELPQHADIESRIAAARDLRQDGELRIEVVVDTMDDSALMALVGGSPHCAALVFAPDGTLVGRQQWLDPTGLPALVAEAREGMRESARTSEGE